MGDAFDGTLPGGCSSVTKINNGTLDPLALGLDLGPILVRLIDALAKIGKGDSNIKGTSGHAWRRGQYMRQGRQSCETTGSTVTIKSVRVDHNDLKAACADCSYGSNIRLMPSR